MKRASSALPGVIPKDRLTAHRAPLHALTGLRFFAAMYVVIYHSKLPDALRSVHLPHAANFVGNGNLAVVLFFLLSGFILAYTYAGQIEGPGMFRRFWEARFARVWPLYAFSLLLCSIVLHSTPSPTRMISTLLMVQAWNPVHVWMADSWNFVCWTLSAEALFYLCFPWLQTALDRVGKQTIVWTVATMALLAILCDTPEHVLGTDTGAYKHLPLALVHLPEFIVGVGIGNLFLQLRNAGGSPIVIAHTSFGALFGGGWWTWSATVLCIFLLCQPPHTILAFTILGFAALLSGLALERSLLQRFLSSRLLLIGGQISYGIYLLQWPCKAFVNGTCDHLHIGSAFLRFLFDLVALIALSAATFYWIENPSRKVIRKFFGGYAR